MAHGSWLMAHGSWLMAHGSWLDALLFPLQILDDSLAPEGRHILHIFTTAWIDDWEVKPALLCVMVLASSCGISSDPGTHCLCNSGGFFQDLAVSCNFTIPCEPREFLLFFSWQGMAPQGVPGEKERSGVAGEIVGRLEAKLFPGLSRGIHFMEVTRFLLSLGTVIPCCCKVCAGLQCTAQAA